MNIGWYCDHERYAAMAAASVASARRVMPGAVCWQLGTMNGVRLAGMDGALFLDCPPGNAFSRRNALQEKLHGEWIFCDVDMIFREDVSHVFAEAFDVAMPLVDDPNVRYTNGLSFSREPLVFHAMLQHPVCKSLSDEPRPILDAIGQTIGRLRAQGLKLLELPSLRYERVPKSGDDRCDGAAIVHYRGPRKRWMPL